MAVMLPDQATDAPKMLRMVHEPVKPVVGAQSPCLSKAVRSSSAAVAPVIPETPVVEAPPPERTMLFITGSTISFATAAGVVAELQGLLPALSPEVACLIAVNRGLSVATVPFCNISPAALAGTFGGMSAMLKIST